MTEATHHYTESGLDYVYLANGFTTVETPYGVGTAIADADRLHSAIARTVIASPAALRGQEVRFLRARLGVSQSALGKILGASRATVARWEGAPDSAIPATADRALRLFYAVKAEGEEVAARVIALLPEIGEPAHALTFSDDPKAGWRQLAA